MVIEEGRQRGEVTGCCVYSPFNGSKTILSFKLEQTLLIHKISLKSVAWFRRSVCANIVTRECYKLR